MNILMDCYAKFPACGSMGSERVVERLCRGFSKLGHKVYLRGKPGSTTNTGAIVVDSIPNDVDIIHKHGFEIEKCDEYDSWGKPWVGTIHGGGIESNPTWLAAVNNHPNIICVSKFVADRLNCKAFVHSCASPEEFHYDIPADNYFIYLAGFGWGMQKGLDQYISLAKKLKKFNFYVAGAGGDPSFVDFIRKVCASERNMRFIGEINGTTKTAYLAAAKALIMPTHLPDACPLTVSETLMCGVPIISSKNGSLPEIVPHGVVGYNCGNEIEYVKAVMNIDNISRQKCREFAMNHYSDLVACQKHLVYYDNVIKKGKVVD